MNPTAFASTGAQLDLIAQVLRDKQVPTQSIEISTPFSSRYELALSLNIDAGQLVRTTAFSVSADEQILFTVVPGTSTLSEPRLLAHLGIEGNKIRRIHPSNSSMLSGSVRLRNTRSNSTPMPLFLIDRRAAALNQLLFFAGDRSSLLSVEVQDLLDFGLAGLASISNSPDEQGSQNLIENVASLADTAQDIESPCISICRFDFENNQCEGCFRTLGEVSRWSRMENFEKRQLLAQLVDRAKHAYLT